MSNQSITFIYFGGEPLGVPVLEELETAGLVPSLIVCSPDRPIGRKQTLTSPPVKTWAQERGIEVWQPEDFKDETTVRAKLAPREADVFVVVAYNHILPQWLLDIPSHGALNLHPSLLPALRGPSPIRTAILNDQPDLVGATVMRLDAEMDHGPILDQMPMQIADENWPVPGPKLDEALARLGGSLLADTLPAYLNGEISPQEQPHELASYTKKFTKADMELTIDPFNLPGGEAAWHAYCAIQAFAGIGDAWFMHHGKRVKIKEAKFDDNRLRLETVVPEGKTAINFQQYLTTLEDS